MGIRVGRSSSVLVVTIWLAVVTSQFKHPVDRIQSVKCRNERTGNGDVSMIDPIIESDNQEQTSWFRRLSPEAQFRILLIVIVAVIAGLAVIFIHWNTWGKPVLIAGAIIAILTGFYKWAVARERASLDY